MKKLFCLLVVAATVIGAQPSEARNPDKPLPLGDGHGSPSLPNPLPVITPGQPGATPPGSSNSLTIGNYSVQASPFPDGGKAIVRTQSETVSGHREVFVHMEASASDGGAFPNSSAFVKQSSPFKLQQPISLQILSGKTLMIMVNNTTYVLPTSPFVGNGSDPPAVALVSLGNNRYQVPLAVGTNIDSIQFNIISNGQDCVDVTADFNNVSINGKLLGIESGSKSTGGKCSPF